MSALHTSSLQSLPLLARGKVRDNYAVGTDRILMLASDRLSAFDVILDQPIPGKGVLLTQMALFWFERLGPAGVNLCPNHLTDEDGIDSRENPPSRCRLEGDALVPSPGHQSLDHARNDPGANTE